MRTESVGLVHYVLPDDGQCRYPGEHRPALIVKVWGPGYVNLQVFVDGTNDYPSAYNGTVWATSVRYSEDHEPRTWHYPEHTPDTEEGDNGGPKGE